MRQMLMPLMFSHDWSFSVLRGEVLVLRGETRGDQFRFANFSAERAGVEPARGSEVDPVFWTTGIDGKWDRNRGQLGASWLVL